MDGIATPTSQAYGNTQISFNPKFDANLLHFINCKNRSNTTRELATPIFHLEFTSTNDGTLYITLIDKRLEHAAQFEVRGHLELLSVFQDVPGSARKLMKFPLKDSSLKGFEISSSTYVTLTAFKSKLQLHSCSDLSLQCSKNRWNSQDANPHQVSG